MPNIVLGVSGSIAAYKGAEIASQLVKLGYDVYPVLTESAAKFISPAVFRALTEKPCPVDTFDEPFPGEIAHIHLGKIADLVLIAPTSMDIIAKLANGLAGDMLTNTVSATLAPVLLAPGMNTNMWNHPATQANLSTLTSYGYQFVDPVSGRLACRTEGLGKMAEPDMIVQAAIELLTRGKLLTGKRILITAGPTREAIDPVRYISNRSSGKMGYAIAEAALSFGAEVTLISGPVALKAPTHAKTIHVVSAKEMHEAAMREFVTADIVFAAAAVADYRPTEASAGKIKKTSGELNLQLTRTTDILAEMGVSKRPHQILVGFAAETSDVERYALQKLKSKHLDFVVANDVSANGAGFDVDTNIATLLSKDGHRKQLPLMTKRQLAESLLEIIFEKEFA